MMKKSGRFVKQLKTAERKQPQVKSLLLQTYFISLLCLVLSVSMFFGTSYAWFTSEVNNTVNEIYVGTLNVGLFKMVTGSGGETDHDLSVGENKLFDGSIRWEPGYTSLEKIRVVNEGELAFKYVMNFTDGALSSDRKSLKEVAEHFDVWVYDHTANSGSPNPETYKDITTFNGWENVGTLDKLLAGEAVLSGKLNTADQVAQNADARNEHTFTIALHMKEDADASLMGHKISLSVKLVAYQMASEADGLGNKDYDNITAADDAEVLKKALGNANNVLLTSDIVIGAAADRMVMHGGVLDGSGNTITYTGERVGDSSVGVLITEGGTISNLTVKGGDNGRALYSTGLTSDLVVTDCNLSGAYAFNLNSSAVTEHTISFTDTYFGSWTSYSNVMRHAYFTNCTFANNLKPYGDTTMTDCKFIIAGLDVSALGSGESITLNNCTYMGTTIERAVLTAEKIEGTGALAINAERMVVLSATP